ncbi:MAG: flavodoxin domain-containing protein [Pseudomonadota bacterium]
MAHVLVTHASRYGSTTETAARIAQVLAAEGLTVELRPAREVDAVEGYDAVVLGAGIYTGRLHKDARHLLPRIGEVPLAVFGMGPSKLDDLDATRAQLDKGLRGVAPFATAVFGGVWDPAKARFPLNKVAAYDVRDWDAVEAWAREVAAACVRTPVAV